MSLSEKQKATNLSRYELGRTAAAACLADQRFSYCLYVPTTYRAEQASDTRLVVAIHGSDRGNAAMRDLFVPLAEECNLIVLAPLFPTGIVEPYEMDNYKYVQFEGIRFDQVILAMLSEVGARYGVDTEKFAMFGFSGGAHLSHRFLYLHPERLSAVSVCAPGSPTMLDYSQDWWVGVRNAEALFGKKVDAGQIAKVAIHLAVGLEDTDTSEITHREGSRHWMEGANGAGVTRIERLHALAASFAANDVPFKADFIEGIGHHRDPLVASAIEFFSDALGGAER